MRKRETIEQLLSIALIDGDGTQWTETRTRNGKQETRTVKPMEAISIAARLEKARGADAILRDRARQIIRLAQWHTPGNEAQE